MGSNSEAAARAVAAVARWPQGSKSWRKKPQAVHTAASIIKGPFCVFVVVMRALLFEVYVRAPDFWELPYELLTKLLT